MLGLDTNVLVRFLVRDDRAQFQRALKLISREAARGRPVYIGLLVLMETEGVLRSRYALSRGEIAAAFSALLESVDVRLEDEGVVERALFVWKDSNAEFADCLIGVRYQALGCRATASFDAKAVKLPGFIAA